MDLAAFQHAFSVSLFLQNAKLLWKLPTSYAWLLFGKASEKPWHYYLSFFFLGSTALLSTCLGFS